MTSIMNTVKFTPTVQNRAFHALKKPDDKLERQVMLHQNGI